MTLNTVRYDQEVDALYIRVAEGVIDDTAEVEPGVIVDVDAEGNMLGVEVLNASGRFDMKTPHDLSVFNAMYAPFIEDAREKMSICSASK